MNSEEEGENYFASLTNAAEGEGEEDTPRFLVQGTGEMAMAL